MSDERTWNPGDSPVLPDASEDCYPSDATPLSTGYDDRCFHCGDPLSDPMATWQEPFGDDRVVYFVNKAHADAWKQDRETP